MILANYVADQIVEKGLDLKARADSGSGAGNREKADISTSLMIFGRSVGIEAKNQKNISHKESWRQTKKLESLGCEPVLAFKDFGEPLEETKVVIYLDFFLEMIKAINGKKISFTNQLEQERAIELIISAAKILEK